jgi:hypothetical protein
MTRLDIDLEHNQRHSQVLDIDLEQHKRHGHVLDVDLEQHWRHGLERKVKSGVGYVSKPTYRHITKS